MNSLEWFLLVAGLGIFALLILFIVGCVKLLGDVSKVIDGD